MPAKDAHPMAHHGKPKWRPGFIRLWLAGTLVLLLATGLLMRPDQDATRYLKHQPIDSAESDLQLRQLMTHARVLHGQGLSVEQIERELLNGGSLTHGVESKLVELKAAHGAREQAKKRLILFATVALFPPLMILELGAALIWARLGFRAWVRPSRKDYLNSVARFLRPLRPAGHAPGRSVLSHKPV